MTDILPFSKKTCFMSSCYVQDFMVIVFYGLVFLGYPFIVSLSVFLYVFSPGSAHKNFQWTFTHQLFTEFFRSLSADSSDV